jgi:hypothetical protein
MGDGPSEVWSSATKTLAYEVTFKSWIPAWDVEVRKVRPPWPDVVARYRVERVRIVTTWQEGPGAPEDQDPKPTVTLSVRARSADGFLSRLDGTLFPEQLHKIPAWLDSLITRAMPRDIP